MPARPARICPRCGKPFRGRCACGYGVGKCRWEDDRKRGTRSQRGYDAAWQACRAAYLAEHPLCEECERQGRVTLAEEVHHVEGFVGLDDERRLDGNNLEALCKRCHRVKTSGRTRRRAG